MYTYVSSSHTSREYTYMYTTASYNTHIQSHTSHEYTHFNARKIIYACVYELGFGFSLKSDIKFKVNDTEQFGVGFQ